MDVLGGTQKMSTTLDFPVSVTESKALKVGWDPKDHLVQPVIRCLNPPHNIPVFMFISLVTGNSLSSKELIPSAALTVGKC